MTAMDEVMQMKQQGQSDEQIIGQLKARGVSEQEIVGALSQSQIKQAVTGAGDNIFGQSAGGPVAPNQFPGMQEPQQFNTPQQNAGVQQTQQGEYRGGFTPQPLADSYGGGFGASQNQTGDPYGGGFGASQNQTGDPYGMGFGNSGQEAGGYSAQPAGPYAEMPDGTGEYAEMQPSMMSQQQNAGYEKVGGEYGQGAMPQEAYGAEGYPTYQPYQEAMSSDVITEISEQVVNERLSALQDKIEKILDMRTVVEANMTNLNDRLKRMEKVVDQMQVSILKKVGDYLTDIQDVKKELEETQKSFVAVQKGKKKK